LNCTASRDLAGDFPRLAGAKIQTVKPLAKQYIGMIVVVVNTRD
jgi:hypothetical protein